MTHAAIDSSAIVPPMFASPLVLGVNPNIHVTSRHLGLKSRGAGGFHKTLASDSLLPGHAPGQDAKLAESFGLAGWGLIA
jgi:hypothetical protein